MSQQAIKKHSLFQYTWPILIELLLQLLVGNVDQIMVNTTSNTAVSAIGNANQILMVLLITFSVISLAVTILATQYFGSNQTEKISQVYTMGLFVNAIFAIVITILLIVFAKPIFTLMKVPPECLQDTITYCNIVACGLVVQSLYTTYVAIFRTRGWMKQTMFVSTIMNIINIIGNFILIRGLLFIPGLGVAGAAISSVGSRLIGLILLAHLFKRESNIPIDIKTLKPFPTALLKKTLAIGLPAGGESISYDMSQLVILSFVNTFGNLVIKVRTFANMFAMLSYMYGSAVSQAAQILVGFDIGAKDYDEANRQVWRTVKYSILIGLAVSITLYLGSDFFYGFLIQDKELLALAKQIMFVEIFLEVGRSVNMTMVRSLQAAGDIKFPAVLGVVSMWGVATALSYIFGIVLGMGLVGVWWAMCLDECLRAVIFIVRWKRGKWRQIKLIEH